MGKPNFSDEFKRDAVAQITERGYPVAEVSQRLGVSSHSLYAWKRQFAKVMSGDAGRKLGAIHSRATILPSEMTRRLAPEFARLQAS